MFTSGVYYGVKQEVPSEETPLAERGLENEGVEHPPVLCCKLTQQHQATVLKLSED